MQTYQALTLEQRRAEYAALQTRYADYQAQKLSLNMARGKPSRQQLDMVSDLLTVLSDPADCIDDGLDVRNYGELTGIPSAKRLFAELLGTKPEELFVGGNASLNLMYDLMAKAYTHGLLHSPRPWSKEPVVRFLCPAPGYDRHFGVSQSLGMELIPIAMTPEGPDMDAVEEAVKDPAVKGMWCVPKFSNPEGITFSDEVVEQIAMMKPAAPDFRIFWDNAYVVHELYDENVHLANIFERAAQYGTEDNIFYFASTSKITFPGSGLAIMAASERNLEQIRPIIATQTIGYDKINQMRHVKFFGSADGIREHMKRHAAILRPKFELVENEFEAELGGCDIAHWSSPRGGYFISLYVMNGCARRVYQLARSVGVTLTTAGSTYPYGRDPHDSNLRIAPSFPEADELKQAIEILCCCIKVACAEKLLKG